MPKQLTPEHKAKSMESVSTFLQRYHNDGDEFLDRIITVDETLVEHKTPDTKQQSMHWRHSGSHCKTKYKQTFVGTESDVHGVLGQTVFDFLTRGETVNTERYCETLQELRMTVQKRRHVILSAGAR